MFLYFDLGNVLLYFDHEIGCRQIAEVAGLTAQEVRRVLLDGDLLARYEDPSALVREHAVLRSLLPRDEYVCRPGAAGIGGQRHLPAQHDALAGRRKA